MKLDHVLKRARELSWDRFGRRITFYLPGMFTCNNCRGKYPALSITADACDLMCDHCRGELLGTMVPAETPDRLIRACIEFESRGNHGVLISGGCDKEGRLPWDRFLPAIEEIRRRTGLVISVHTGLVDDDIALGLKHAGVDQALIDVVGDDRTLQDIYHVSFGVDRIAASLAALTKAGLTVVPHIVCGLYHGQIRGEERAAEMIAAFDVPLIAIVALMKNTSVSGWDYDSPDAASVARVIARTRMMAPRSEISLGCARKRGDTDLELLAIDAGVNRLALPSEEAVAHALGYGLDIRYQKTCCSAFGAFDGEAWI
jgi:lipoyl synthase